ncbi:MAG: inorganic phosphate transporter [Saprospiraceae bacterium]|nr:inorganic phosphate transporter [Saprospiraceae bacterium]
MFGVEISTLSTGLFIAFVACLIMTFFFEFVNGFHDTANAVATVIYTKSLKPVTAVVWSGTWNFAGVLFSSWLGLEVAMKIANLLPVEAVMSQAPGQSAAMVLAVLLGAIIWNLGTWYFGIPCSSSHTLIGSLLGVGMVFSTLPENTSKVGVNWSEAIKIGNSLLFSPLFGFSMAIVLMFILRSVVKGEQTKGIFKEPPADAQPPLWIRAILITTCTLVSFFHGQNDGQKGIGLLMVALMTFMPLQYSLSPSFEPTKVQASLTAIQQALPADQINNQFAPKELAKTVETIELLKTDIGTASDVKSRLSIRKRINLLTKNVKSILDEPNIITDRDKRAVIKSEIKALSAYTHYAPIWSIILISVALGVGTMIGWKRIVVTIGEKIGKRHMTYAEGATAELIAASTIGLSSYYGLPVSTTHVLSSGVAGSMVASKGVKNLQKGTITNIALAWVLTLPATIILSGGLYLLFRLFA